MCTMNKGEETKLRIIEQTSGIFNTKGYYGTTMSDVMLATGLKKGGLYNHFVSKEDLALQVFQHNTLKMSECLARAIASKVTHREKLLAFFRTSLNVYRGHPIKGGCPVLNAGIEADDFYPPLQVAAQKALKGMKKIVLTLLESGIKEGEFNSNINPKELTDFFICSLEGGVFVSKLQGDDNPLKSVINNLETKLSTIISNEW